MLVHPSDHWFHSPGGLDIGHYLEDVSPAPSTNLSEGALCLWVLLLLLPHLPSSSIQLPAEFRICGAPASWAVLMWLAFMKTFAHFFQTSSISRTVWASAPQSCSAWTASSCASRNSFRDTIETNSSLRERLALCFWWVTYLKVLVPS